MVIETERLRLRPLGLADIDEFLALHDDPDVTRFIRPLERREADERLRLVEREWLERGHGMFAVFDRASGRFLGRAGLKHWSQFDETELGWVLRRDAWTRVRDRSRPRLPRLGFRVPRGAVLDRDDSP